MELLVLKPNGVFAAFKIKNGRLDLFKVFNHNLGYSKCILCHLPVGMHETKNFILIIFLVFMRMESGHMEK